MASNTRGLALYKFNVGILPFVPASNEIEGGATLHSCFKFLKEYNINPILRRSFNNTLETNVSILNFSYSTENNSINLQISFTNSNEIKRLDKCVDDGRMANFFTEYFDSAGLSTSLGFDHKEKITIIVVKEFENPNQSTSKMEDLGQQTQLEQNSNVKMRIYVPRKPKEILNVTVLWNDQQISLKNKPETFLWTSEFKAKIHHSEIQIQVLQRKASGILMFKGYVDYKETSDMIYNYNDLSIFHLVFPVYQTREKDLNENVLSSFCQFILNDILKRDENQAFQEIESLGTKQYFLSELSSNFDQMDLKQAQRVAQDIIKSTLTGINARNMDLICYILFQITVRFSVQDLVGTSFVEIAREIVEKMPLLSSTNKEGLKYKTQIGSTLEKMYHIANGEKACVLGFITRAFSYLGIEYLNKLVSTTVVNKTKAMKLFVDESPVSLNDGVQFLYERQAYNLLEKTLRHLPDFCKSSDYIATGRYLLRISDGTEFHGRILDLYVQKYQQTLVQATKGGGLNDLICSWKKIRELHQSMHDKLIQYVENGILECLEQETKVRKFEEIKQELLLFANTNEIFATLGDKERLLEACLAAKKSRALNGFVKDLLKNDKYQSLPNAEKHIIQWLQNSLNLIKTQYSQEERIVKTYEYQDFLFELSIVQDDEVLKSKIDDVIFSSVENISIRVLLTVVPKVETREKLQRSFQDHIQRLLQGKHSKRLPKDIIKDICGVDHLRIRTRLTAQILKVIIDLLEIREDDNLWNTFMKSIDHSTFWIEVFSSEGTESIIKDLHSYPPCRKVTEAIHYAQTLLFSRKLSFSQTMELDTRVNSFVDILSICKGKTRDQDIEKKIRISVTKCCGVFKSYVKSLDTILKIFQNIKDGNRNCNSLPIMSIISETIDSIASIKAQLKRDEIWERDFYDGNSSVDEIRNIAECCKTLEKPMKSFLFGNLLNSEVRQIKPNINYENVIPSEPLDSVSLPELFGQENENDKSFCNLTSSLIFIQDLSKRCLEQYEKLWMPYINKEDKPLRDFKMVFHKIRGSEAMETEIELAEEHFNRKLPAKVKRTLIEYADLKRYRQTVNAVKVSVDIFKFRTDPKIYTDIVQSFDQLFRKGTDAEFQSMTYKSMEDVLAKVDKIRAFITPAVTEVLEVVKSATLLLDFLTEVIDEDIRNLIDAVEEHSEQSVRESTVSDLIEVKRFFFPIIKRTYGDEFTGFFSVLNKQLTTGFTNIPEKIMDCMDNLHTLKALYKNVANRGELTKEIIDCIVKKGKFWFQIQDQTCSVSVTYTQDKSDVTHKQGDLSDLRSRALLLMNAEEREGLKEKHKKKKEHLQKFLNLVDTAFQIAQLCCQLKQTGHFEYIQYQKTLALYDLVDHRNRLKQTYEEWTENLADCRRVYYYMNFVFPAQLQQLYEYLHKNMHNEQEVQTCLQFIDSSFCDLASLRNNYQSIGLANGSVDILKNIARALQITFQDFCPIEIALTSKKRFFNIADEVQPGTPYIAALDHGSHLVIRTMFALFINTTRSIPSASQILFCRNETTIDELELIFYRCSNVPNDKQKRRLYCVANVELLHHDVQGKLVEMIHNIPGNQFLLAIICCGDNHHPFLEQFSEILSRPSPMSEAALKESLQSQWPDVYIVSSDVPGSGKTEFIHKRAREMKLEIKTLHISGKIDLETIIENLQAMSIKSYHLLHIDVGTTTIPQAVDNLMFQLIVLRHLSTGSKAYTLSTKHVYVEVANTVGQNLCNSIPTTTCFKRYNVEWKNFTDMNVSSEINSPVQVVCHYLRVLEMGLLDRTDLYFTGTNTLKPLPKNECIVLLQKCFSATGEMSYTLLQTFLNVLADQLKKLSASVFFRTSSIAAMIDEKSCPTVKSKLCRAMIDASKEFACRSVQSCRSLQESNIITGGKKTYEQLTPSEELAKRIQGMIRWEDSNHLMILFHQNVQTVSALYRQKRKVLPEIRNLFESQMQRQLEDYSEKSQIQLQNILKMITRSKSNQHTKKPITSDYALTPDNLLKMVLISLRVNANIPVVIMGETGCGKTSLVRYLAEICDIKMTIMSIHAGIEEEHINEKVKQLIKEATASLSSNYWLFLDEINTCDHLGIINSIICHRLISDQYLPPNVTVLAACNPYRLRSHSTILTAGLQGKVKTDELSRLVYRVHPLPESLIDFVWDYGSLDDHDEKLYISRMITAIVSTSYADILTELLVVSQRLVRAKENTDSCVSLRDVDRCRQLVIWFISYLKKKKTKPTFNCSIEMKSMILALAVSYHSRFTDSQTREEYRKHVAEVISKHQYKVTPCDVLGIIREEQNELLDRMDLPPGIAKNTALQENVFVVLVSILNRIPVFLVGKPGCSKSLSMQLLRSNLRGKDSKNVLFQKMPQLFCVSFQGSESSTSDGIIKVFEKAENYQKHNEQDVISVVILDEIGLAEISRFNPLKVLHGLLEPAPRQNPDVAVVGISNWALDAAKMNRAVHLSRPDMDLEELKYTGNSIIRAFTFQDEETETDDSDIEINITILESIFDQIAVAYFTYINGRKKFENFHGLRDYYSLIKYLGRWKDRLPISPENANIILKGIARNFGGLPSEIDGIVSIFKESFPEISKQLIPTEELIMENLSDESCRHLMLITNGDSVISLLECNLNDRDRAYEVIFGSHFDEDLSDDYNYRILSRIILCMEQGLVLILKGLESIYGSLYDMLNQNYTIVGHKKNCRIALGHYSNPMCHVHDSFKCIVLVEESKLDYSDPPFLNRFEKQQFRFSDTLKGSELNSMVEEIEETFKELCKLEGNNFTCQTEIPSFNRDLIVSLILFINKTKDFDPKKKDQYLKNAFTNLLWMIPPEVIVRARESKLCQENPGLVQEMSEIYFGLPLHNGLIQCLEYLCNKNSNDENNKSQMILCYTYTNVHFNIKSCIPYDKYHVERLSNFKSEKQLANTINDFFTSEQEVLLIQCSACYDSHHLLLTKFIIENARRKATISNKYICMIVHLDRNVEHSDQFVPLNFLSGWKLLFLDSLQKPRTPIQHFLKCTKFEIVQERKPLTQYINDHLFWALTRIKFTSKNNEIDDQKCLMDKMRVNDVLMSTLEILILKWIEDQSMESYDQWGIDVAKSAHELYRSGSLVSAFENRINDVIKYPIAMYLYKMLKFQLLSPVFIDDQKAEGRIQVWTEIVLTEKYTRIDKLPPITGPECYSCSTPYKSLRMPLSCVFMDKINLQKEEFLEIIRKLRIYNDIDDEEEVPSELLIQTIDQCVDIICHDVSGILGIEYDGWMDDYFHDFCNVSSMSYFTSVDESKTTRIFKWAFKQLANDIELESLYALKIVSMIHASLWVHGSAVLSLCQLVELSELLLPMILSTESDQDVGDGNRFALQTELQPMYIELMNRTDLVECICKQLLGTRLLFESMPMFEWISITNKIIPLAKQVVIENKYMPALQLMTELIMLIVKEEKINVGQLHDISDTLIQNEGQIHIQSSFDLVVGFLNTRHQENPSSTNDVQRVFCSYVLRCLHTQPDEIDILKSALTMPPEVIHTDSNWSYFGKCVTLAIIIDTMENENAIFDIIGNDMEEMPPFIACLDDFLRTENPNEKTKLALSSLISDVIEMTCLESAISSEALQGIESASDELIKYLMAASDVASNDTAITFRYIAAVAFIKRFLFLVHGDIETILECQVVVNHVNTIIADNWESNVTNPFMVYFLKLIASQNGLLGLRKYCQNNNTWASFGQISWMDEYYKTLLTMHPLLLYIDPEVQNTYFGQINNVLEKGNTVDELFGSDELDLIVLLDVIASNFYIRKCIKELNDAESRIASEVNKRIQGSKINGRVKQISKYLLCEEFELPLFNLSESTKTPTPEIVSLILHLCCLVPIKAKDSSEWLVALLKPKQGDIATNLCLASTNTETVSVMILKFLKGCITIGSIGFNFVPNMPFSDQPEKHSVAVYAIFNELAHSLIMNYRDTCDFLHHIIHNCQVHIIEGSTTNEMLNLIDEMIPNRWEIIVEKRRQLSSVYKCEKCIEAQIDEIPFSDEKYIEVQIDEIPFSDEKCIEAQIDEIVGSDEICIEAQIDEIAGSDEKCIEAQIDENTISDEKCIEAQIEESPISGDCSLKLLSLLRITLKPTKENFELELQHCKGEKYAFLSFVFKHKKQLSLLKHLPVLLRWYVTVVESASYKFRKVDFKDLTIQKFFSRETDDSKRGILKKHFELFRKSWTEIKEDYKSILDEKIVESMESVTTLSEMKSCTILHDGAILATIFRELVGLNNSFLNKMAQMSDDNQEGVSQQPVKLLELRANNVLTFSWDDDWLKFSQCNTMLGLGQNIFFDFDKIQEEVTKNVLHGKCRIECPDTFPKPVFTDDLYQNSVQLLLDVQSCILQQNITNEIRKSVQQKTDRDASFVTELLSYIGMVMSLIKKTGGDGSQPLIEYMEKWQSITSITSKLCKRILPEPTDSVKLCHVVALYQFLEEMNGMSLVDTLDNSYRTSLPTDAADVLRKAKKELMVYVDKMVHPLFVFVHRYLALKNNDIEMDHTLVDYLNSSDLWWNDDFSDGCIYGATVKDKIPLKDVISPLILIEHVFETITFVQDAVKESKEYNARISTISMDYIKKQTSSKPTRSRTARKFMKM